MTTNPCNGYKGVMDLDLSGVDPIHHKTMKLQHLNDIHEYTKYQAELPLRLRYENTIGRALVQINKEQEITLRYNNVKLLEQKRKI